MRLHKKSLILISLATPLTALPLINATYVSTNLVNEETETYTFGQHASEYTVRFITDSAHTDWGTFGEIYSMNLKGNEDVFAVPATVNHNGQIVKIRRINTMDRCPCGNKWIKLLDFSNAIWLDELCDQCFDHGKGHCKIKINWVNFKGARNLTRIGNWAFSHQYLNDDAKHNNNWIDLSQTKLQTIAKSAFSNSVAGTGTYERKRWKFAGIIFPSTLTSLEEKIFDYTTIHESLSPHFEKIIMLSSNPPSDLLHHKYSLPMMCALEDHSEVHLQFIVPNGSLNTYKSLKNIQSYHKTYAYESHLIYKDDIETKLVSQKEVGGVSHSVYDPYDVTTSSYNKDAILEIDNTYGGKISINKDHKIQWSKDLKPGEYTFHVNAKQYDDKNHYKLSYVQSPLITLKVLGKYGINGGSRQIYIAKNKEGSDQKVWKPYIFDSKIKSVSYEILDDASGKISYEKDGDLGCRIKWDAFDSDIDERFTIKATIIVDEVWTVVTTQQVHLVVSDRDLNFGIVLQYKKPGESEFKDYNGETLVFDSTLHDKPYTFQMTITGEQTGKIEAVKTPEPSTYMGLNDVTGGNFVYTQQLNQWDITVYNGEYHFYYICDITISGTIYRIYSDLITIQKDQSVENLSVLPTELTITKNVAGSCPLSILSLQSNQVISNVEISRKSQNSGYIGASISEDGKEVILDWDKEFTTTEDLYRICDISLAIDIKDEATNEETYLNTSLTMISTNIGSIAYSGDRYLYTYGETTKTFDTPFRYLVNNASPTDCSKIVFSAEVNGDTEHKYLEKIGISYEPTTNEALLSCTGLEETSETLKGLEVIIKAYDTNTWTYDSQSVLLYAGNILMMDEVPSSLELEKGVSGQSSTFTTIWNGEIATDVTYEIEGMDEGSIIVKDNRLVWNGNYNAGSYDVKLTAKKQFGENTYTDTCWISVTVTETPEPGPEPTPTPTKSNTALIIGASAGGAVAVAGAATGITLGVKKHKAKLTKKKK